MFIVSNRGSLKYNGQLYRRNQVVEIDEAAGCELVGQGLLRFVDSAPAAPALKAQGGELKVVVVPAPDEDAHRVTGSKPWNMNPEHLADKPLDELRLLIAERDPSVPADQLDIAEAVALLSQDYAG